MVVKRVIGHWLLASLLFPDFGSIPVVRDSGIFSDSKIIALKFFWNSLWAAVNASNQ